MFAAKNELLTRPSGGYQISRSLRFNSADSTTLNRTFATNGTSRTTSTISFWVKLVNLELGEKRIVDSYDGSSPDSSGIYYDSNKFVIKFGGSASAQITTTAVYRDPSAWYHLCAVFDSTQATSTNRIKFYVNGVQVTSFSSSTYPNLNTTFVLMSSGVRNYIGDAWNAPGAYAVNLYLTEFYYIDGQALTPSSFGSTNADTGVWQPKAYSGSYGTNGFYLNFSDNSNNTSTTLGKDYSGNGNNWTPNGFIVTAGAGNDSLVDSPTSYGTDTGVGGTVRGNYATLNPLNKGSSQTFANGNLQTSASSSWGLSPATFGMSSGKWYCEATQTVGTLYSRVGISTKAADINNYVGVDPGGWAYINNTGDKGTNLVTSVYGSSWTTNDTIGISFDADAGTLVFYKNGVSQGTAFTGLTSGPYFFTFSAYDVTFQVNFGQRPFAYTAPSGFKALCTQNLPTPTIGATTATQAGKFFNPVIYTGNGVNPRSITGVGFQPDFVWGKRRSFSGSHFLTDSVRGIQRILFSEATDAEVLNSPNGAVQSFDSDGVTFQGSSTNNNLNNDAITYVAWNWKANGSGSSNTAGSITSTVSASTTSGFSVVTFTGNATAGATIGHGLGATPQMIFVKGRVLTTNWFVYNSSIGATKYLYLNLTDSAGTYSGFWNNTAPTSSVFSLGNDGTINASGSTYVAYCFAEVAGYSAIGTYTANGSADGPFIFCGFRPAFILTKKSSGATAAWGIWDIYRSATYNPQNGALFPNNSSAEFVNNTYSAVDVLSNGFKIRNVGGEMNETNGDTYIYMAFASNPFKYSLAR